MFSILKWKCSWSMISAVASIVGLVSLMLDSKVHLLFFPLVPSFEYFSQTHNSCVPINASTEAITDHFRGNLEPPIDLENHFPADLHKVVVFCGAPWKAEIGRWLAGCGSISNKVNIVELIGGSGCKNDCSGRGFCNCELGQCRCFHGYSGQYNFIFFLSV
ncbi:uncharacterized protein LOC133708509 [Rosa rugosa]|uniref:uncharacterized protein LOC133708509 n=1 Tax=Rosa rugosa TaxID=74645 RepID=UPI002B411D4E|nr:uncharacterized protein LOC133708509 [Rosa rugosa]